MNSNGQEDVLAVHEVFRALALSIVHFNTTEYQQVNNRQDNQYTATEINNYYHSSRFVTRNGHFNLEDLQHALYYHVTRQALKNVCPSIFEWPFQYEQSFELRINGEKVKSRKLCYNSASYESNITNLKISLGIGDVPLNVLYTTLYDRLISEYYLLKDKKALKDKEKLDKPIASRTRNSSSSGSSSGSSSCWSSIISSNSSSGSSSCWSSISRRSSSSKTSFIITGIRELTDTNDLELIIEAATQQLQMRKDSQEGDTNFTYTNNNLNPVVRNLNPATPINNTRKDSRGTQKRSYEELEEDSRKHRNQKNHNKDYYRKRLKEGDLKLVLIEEELRVMKERFKKVESQLEKTKEADTDEQITREDRIDSMFLSLFSFSASMQERTKHGHIRMSLRAGLIAQFLISVCGVSLEKLGWVVTAVLMLVFGKLSADTLKKVCATSNTYLSAMERVKEAYGTVMTEHFTFLPGKTDSFIGVCLAADASKKLGRDLVHKPFTALLLKGNIVERTFSTDVTITKKAKEGADQTIQSLKKQCDPYGWMKITCGTADVFGLAEIKLVLEAFDKDASSLGDDDDYENVDRKFASTSVPGQVFRYDVKFRADRTLSCRMHAVQNVFQPLLKAFLNIQGLSNSATTAQNLYSLSYYMSKLKEQIKVLHVISAGWDINEVPERIAIEMRYMVTQICATRWVSTERCCDQVWKMLNVKATPEFIAFFEVDYLQEDKAELYAYIACPLYPDSPSYLILMLLYLANHAAGGKKADHFKRCGELVGFLTSSYHRVAIRLVAELYPLHLRYSAFFNGPSEVHGGDVESISTRAIETIVFERSILQELHRLDDDWHSFFPDASDYVTLEAERAVKEDEEEDEENRTTVESFIDAHDADMKSGIAVMIQRAHKYFIQGTLSRGWVPLYVTDPFISVDFAVGILEAFESNGYIDNLDKSVFQSLTSEDQSPLSPWSMECPVYAFPGISHSVLRKQVKNMFTLGNDHTVNESIEGIIAAYGLRHSRIIDELLILSTGRLKAVLETHVTWRPGTPVKQYWDWFNEIFPALGDMLTHNFSYVLITSTVAEIMFTWTPDVGDSNSSGHSIDRSVNFYANIRGEITRSARCKRRKNAQPVSVDDTDELEKKRHRPFRTKTEQYGFLHSLLEIGDTLQHHDVRETSCRELRSRRSKKRQLMERMPHTLAEMKKNARGIRTAHNLDSIKIQTGRYNASWLTKETALPPLKEDAYVKWSKDTTWNKESKLLYLLRHETEVDKEIIQNAKLNATDDGDGLVQILEQYWRKTDTDPDTLEAIVQEWRTSGVQEITTYTQAATHKSWRGPLIKKYLKDCKAFTEIIIKEAKMKRKDTDLPTPQYHTLPELLVKYWTDSNTHMEQLTDIIDAATIT